MVRCGSNAKVTCGLEELSGDYDTISQALRLELISHSHLTLLCGGTREAEDCGILQSLVLDLDASGRSVRKQAVFLMITGESRPADLMEKQGPFTPFPCPSLPHSGTQLLFLTSFLFNVTHGPSPKSIACGTFPCECHAWAVPEKYRMRHF